MEMTQSYFTVHVPCVTMQMTHLVDICMTYTAAVCEIVSALPEGRIDQLERQ